MGVCVCDMMWMQTVKTMIAMVIVYALCWLPLHCITVLGDLHQAIWSFQHIQLVWIACHWLAMSSVCWNPIVYYWTNDTLRAGFTYAVGSWCLCAGWSWCLPIGLWCPSGVVVSLGGVLVLLIGSWCPVDAPWMGSWCRCVRRRPVAVPVTACRRQVVYQSTLVYQAKKSSLETASPT